MKKTILLLSIFSIIISSCHKDPTPDIPPVVITQNDSITLSMYVDLDTTHVSGKDTLEIQKYEYDMLKRVITVRNTEYTSGKPSDLDESHLFYNGTDTLPYKKIETYNDLLGSNTYDPSTAYYFYSEGKISRDSVMDDNAPFYSVRKFSYDNNLIIETISDASTPPNVQVHKFYQVRNNGNTISQKDSSFVNGIWYGGTDIFTYSYDTKKNPFYNLPQPYMDREAPYYIEESYIEEMVYERNNPTEISESEFHLNYVYEYNQNGYPSIARVYDLHDASTLWYKRIFIYTKL